MIERRKKAKRDFADAEHVPYDLLGLLIDSSNREVLPVQDVIEECKIFYLAGNETTTVLLTWTMVVLAMHEDWQERAREEVHYEGLTQLKIVTVILYEILRLYPPVLHLNRITCKPTELGGVTYPPGVMLSLLTAIVHHDPELWGSDAANSGRSGSLRACQTRRGSLAPSFPLALAP